jgi:hypothetical protein
MLIIRKYSLKVYYSKPQRDMDPLTHLALKS